MYRLWPSFDFEELVGSRVSRDQLRSQSGTLAIWPSENEDSALEARLDDFFRIVDAAAVATVSEREAADAAMGLRAVEVEDTSSMDTARLEHASSVTFDFDGFTHSLLTHHHGQMPRLLRDVRRAAFKKGDLPTELAQINEALQQEVGCGLVALTHVVAALETWADKKWLSTGSRGSVWG